ncbi:MAG: glycoside hydrolase family 78 protein [Armatimonadetes bacterium]|nr:glycoside hydrolase family 78 protein [Armatimonadota bacterium]
MFQDTTFWIWGAENAREHNRFVRFRRRLTVTGAVSNATLKITADARYEVWINGNWIGNGPPRSWPSPWPVDEYDIGAHLREGENLVAVRVHHFGIGTFQYLHNEAGLRCELNWSDQNGAHFVGSDASWSCHDDERFAARVPRISCQQGWEEQFDAREENGDWTRDLEGFDWPLARVLEEDPHPILEARTIPFLTQERIAPARFLGAQAVQTTDVIWSLQMRELLNSDDKSANMLRGRVLIATHIWSSEKQEIEIHAPHHPIAWKLNGESLSFDAAFSQPTDAGIARATLQAGWNHLLGKLPEMAHEWAPVLNFWTPQRVRFAARPDEAQTESPWLSLGPFESPCDDASDAGTARPHYICAREVHPDAKAARFYEIWERGALSEAEISAPITRIVPASMVCETDIFALCTSERVVPDVEVQLENAPALCAENNDWTTIFPPPTGDARLLLDFGDEVVGPLQWEVEAGDGAILDWHFFEFIQKDGRINLCEGMNNTLRYTCREGRQSYRSFVRHGFRFAWLSVRSDAPVKIRGIRAIFNTIPDLQIGRFECDDALLNQIWRVGARSVRCCAEDTYTDCPSYEQTHWVGDARNEALVDWVVNGDARLSQHSWIQAARSLERSPLVEGEVPSAWEVVLPAWSFLWMRWGREIWDIGGDRSFARHALPFLERNARGIAENVGGDGLFRFAGWNMFDWAPMDTPASGAVTHLNCLAVLGLRETAQIARDLGETELATRWTELAQGLSDAVNRHLWDENRGAYADCLRSDGTLSPVLSQQTQTAAFIAGVASDHSSERAARCRAILDEAPPGFVEAGSPFFMFFVLEALAREERGVELVQTIRDYWGLQTQAGATTFWETYFAPSNLEHGASQINGASLHRLTRSHCHGWSAAPTYFLSTYVLGVQSGGAGFSPLVIAPHAVDLAWCKGAVPTPHGVVEVSWKNEKGAPFELEVSAPQGLEVQVRLPRAGMARVNGEVVNG